ncbi:LytR C-terminal domain-containing protein [Streptomyces sp. H27-D2]|uniref:LytR C-terminal domain-containing protein n=1 Tax=Streptomyces sp. H27-D2 TaxID=3046304 RepID=UPI002DBF11E3|nr:LytR C-terminal domain-containing protein [Streptomyces sp. H27-D2]MEC4018916.1 LytR C-terminal domain-containing protein [Streptomyces sp. H27-D2]
MSMLTPPGMGGKNRITGDKYPRMRRPRHRYRIALALVGAVAALSLIGWGTSQLIDVFGGGSTSRASAGDADCKAGPSGKASPRPLAALAKPPAITVNVFNATPRSGLAKSAADELKKRGFKIGKVGNAPAAYDRKVLGAGILLGAPAAAEGSFKVLGAQLPGADVKTDARKGKDVDLILGKGFKKLTTKKDADKALAALAKPSSTSAPSKC